MLRQLAAFSVTARLCCATLHSIAIHKSFSKRQNLHITTYFTVQINFAIAPLSTHAHTQAHVCQGVGAEEMRIFKGEFEHLNVDHCTQREFTPDCAI